MIILVNGYVCTSSCEAAKARHGQDPHTQSGQLPGTDDKKTSALDSQPAVTFGGSLKDAAKPGGATSAFNASSASGASSAPPSAGSSVNLLV